MVHLFFLAFYLGFVDSLKTTALGVRHAMVPEFPCLHFHDRGGLRAVGHETVDGAETLLVLAGLKLAINSVKTMTLCLPRHTVMGKGEYLKT